MVWYDETSWNMLQVYCIQLHACVIFMCCVLLCVHKRGFKSNSDLSEQSQVRVATRKSAHMQNWHEEVRNEGRKGVGVGRRWIKQSLSLTGGAFKNSKTSFTLEDGLCVSVWERTRMYFPVHLRICVRMSAGRAHESNRISLQRAVLALPAAPDTQLRWADEKWIKEQQKKGRINNERELWLQIVVWLVHIYCMCVCLYGCVHKWDVFILWFTLCTSF